MIRVGKTSSNLMRKTKKYTFQKETSCTKYMKNTVKIKYCCVDNLWGIIENINTK